MTVPIHSKESASANSMQVTFNALPTSSVSTTRVNTQGSGFTRSSAGIGKIIVEHEVDALCEPWQREPCQRTDRLNA